MLFSEKARWIWINGETADTYCEFKDKFCYSAGKAVLYISAETNYCAEINGKTVGYGQYAGYKNEKYFDTIDVTEFCVKGENEFRVTVWYEGLNSFTHIDHGAGVIFSVKNDGEEVLYSSKNTLCALSGKYVNGQKKLLTYQLGYSCSMINGETSDFSVATEKDLPYNFAHRPVERLKETEFRVAKKIGDNVYDLGRETAGYLSVKFLCESAGKVNVSYGEYLDNGKVHRFLPGGYKNAGRDFSFDFYCKAGENSFTQHFVRFAGRYLEIDAEIPVKVEKIGVIVTEYPVEEKGHNLKGLDKKIYDVCVDTLKLCMHEHYEDCPWREQSLYTMDSRNQMLCGYYAFKGFAFQRANLVLISKGLAEGGLLELNFPAVDTPSIPFFSLMYIVELGEYVKYSGDISILDEVWGTVKRIYDTFVSFIDDTGLLPNLPYPFWNFYEWSKGSANDDELKEGEPRTYKHDLILNCAFLYAYKHYEYLAAFKSEVADFNVKELKESIIKTFFDKDKELFFLSDKGERIFSQLGNSFALLTGICSEKIIDDLKYNKELVPATLSMKCFLYDAVLTSGSSYDKQFVLDEIRNNYSYMLDNGATSFWETIEGVSVSKSQSLCHGWSAIPIYYYNIIGENANE